MSEDRLIWFTGRECEHCKELRPIVAEFMDEYGVEIEELEVWHDERNANLLRKYGEDIAEACGGDLAVPSFYNEATGSALCGKVTKELLKLWADIE